jgi:hypothetical protein
MGNWRRGLNITDIERKKVFDQINAKKQRPWQGEEEVRLAWISAIEVTLGIHFDAERARKDGSYNHVLIEFKAPGLFKGSKKSAKFKEATTQRLLPYILRESKKTGIPPEDYIGIAIDGVHICFARVADSELITQHLIPFSEYAVGLVIQAIKTDIRRAITTENLLADFGHGSRHAKGLMQAMSDALSAELARKDKSKIRMLYEEWRSLYGQVADMSTLHHEMINQELCFDWKGSLSDTISGRLFVIHTYNSLLIKLLAAEIVSGFGLTTTQQPAQAMSALMEDAVLFEVLSNDIERAGIFTQAGIHGFVEEVIFSWYLDIKNAYSKEIILSIRNVLASLSLYRTDRLSHTRDVLRDLYQVLVPGRLRQSLGEFYTPDWLVDFTVEKARNGKWLDKRVLDPTCGSGAFLISILREKIKEAKQVGWCEVDIVQHLCSSVWGFDLNPLAVQTARVNFLMEIVLLLKKCPGLSIEVPVLLADAIYSPAPTPENDALIVIYQIGSEAAGLEIRLPSVLAFDRARLDLVFKCMGENVDADIEYIESERMIIAAGILAEDEAEEWREPLGHTYNQILKLHRQRWNGIWFRVVRNFFWSATAGLFDCIVGNPPWVRWSKLPDTYRERVKPTCDKYGIFSKTKRHGGNELDISAMITYTTADKWLKNKGRLAFLLTGTLFKNPSSAGFRDFKLNQHYYLVPIEVDDLKALKPFSDAANHTAIAVFDKSNKSGTYPIPYRLWDRIKGVTKNIPGSLALDEVLSRVEIVEYEAAPVGELGSPWAVLRKGRYQFLQFLSGTCKWVVGRKGITTDLNGVYFVPVVQDNGQLVQIQSRPEAGKKDIGAAKTAWVEPNILYPLINGASDFEACYLKLSLQAKKDRLYVLLPNQGIGKGEYDMCQAMLNSKSLSNTKNWFLGYKDLLESRSTYRLQMKSAPFYAVYNVGEYAFKSWKVIWPEMSTKFYAAVVGSVDVPIVGKRPYIPDHKIYYAAFDEKAPAYFLCGLLNTDIVAEWVESHNVSIQVGDVFKHMNLPMYDAQDKSHKEFSLLVEHTHQEHDKKERLKIISKVKKQGLVIIEKSVSCCAT